MGVWLDDEFPEHPKVEALEDDLAAWLYVSGLCYANRNLTGGRIPKAAALRLTNKANKKLIAKLLAPLVPGKGPLWEDHGDHYRIHDYVQHQQSAEKRRAEVEEAKKKRSEHARRAAMARHHPDDAQGSSTDRASPEQPPGIEPAGPGALLGDARDLARPRAPSAADPTPFTTYEDPPPQTDLPSASAEEEDHDRGDWNGLLVARLVAKRRCAKLTNPPPEGFRRDAWLKTTAEDVLFRFRPAIAEHLAAGQPIETVVDLLEPPEPAPTAPASPYPAYVPPADPGPEPADAGNGLAMVRSALGGGA
jgi:hypothetical protein